MKFTAICGAKTRTRLGQRRSFKDCLATRSVWAGSRAFVREPRQRLLCLNSDILVHAYTETNNKKATPRVVLNLYGASSETFTANKATGFEAQFVYAEAIVRRLNW